ncbi:gp53-like domain-containing protein [Ensifer sp. MJa1]|uniref:gp53-like domain-containing protein n=1 Tax=Ensifer sp. MJa1 TaxID=2919888 RepID=UPI003008C06E
MTTPYTTGSITLTNGSAVVTGVGTAWQTALIAGGTIYAEADGNPLPILTVDSNTQITAAIKWKGATGTYPYAIMRDTAYGQQTVANANALATYLQRLDNASLAALASIAATLGAGKVPRGLSANTMEWFTVTDFIKTLLDDADAGTARGTLGAQAALGFTPVQQGGGSGQGGNKVYVGWDPSKGLTAQVDTSVLGKLWYDGLVTGGLGWLKFPNGMIIQSGTVVVTADGNGFADINLPVSFASASNYVPVAWNGDGNINVVVSHYRNASRPTAGLFSVLVKNTTDGLPRSGAVRVDFIAWGY